MGYHLTVLRTEGFRTLPIPRSEFVAEARRMPELILSVDETSAGYIRAGELRATIFWTEGVLWTKVPDEDVVTVLISLAERLQARVRGDDLETYRSAHETYVHPDDAQHIAQRDAQVARIRFRERVWSVTRVIVLVAVVVAVILRMLG